MWPSHNCTVRMQNAITSTLKPIPMPIFILIVIRVEGAVRITLCDVKDVVKARVAVDD